MIIFLNGCSSSGKTMVAKAIQHISDQPWLLIGIDTFFQMLPTKYVGFGDKAHEGYHFVPKQDQEGPLMHVETGPIGKALTQSMPRVIQSLVEDGHNLIVDEVLFSDEELERYVQALAKDTVYFVGVMCDLQTLQERELLREDRAIGLGRDQYMHVHDRQFPYDLMINTTRNSAFVCAQEIMDYMKQHPNPKAFKQALKGTKKKVG